MKTFTVGDVFCSDSHTALINKTVGSTLKFTQKCWIDLSDFQCDGVVAWFVFMNDVTHGYFDWNWANKLSENGKTIYERNMDSSKTNLKRLREEDGYHPFRLAFMLDPYKVHDRFCCRFIGAFRLDAFVGGGTPDIVYTKVADSFTIGSKGEYCDKVTDKAKFFENDERYNAKIEALNLSDMAYTMLKKANIKRVGELLEIGLGDASVSFEIKSKLENFFRKL